MLKKAEYKYTVGGALAGALAGAAITKFVEDEDKKADLKDYLIGSGVGLGLGALAGRAADITASDEPQAVLDEEQKKTVTQLLGDSEKTKDKATNNLVHGLTKAVLYGAGSGAGAMGLSGVIAARKPLMDVLSRKLVYDPYASINPLIRRRTSYPLQRAKNSPLTKARAIKAVKTGFGSKPAKISGGIIGSGVALATLINALADYYNTSAK